MVNETITDARRPWLSANAPVLLKDAVLDSVFGVGMPSLRELLQFALENNVRVYT